MKKCITLALCVCLLCLCAGAMGTVQGVIFLTDADSRVYVYGEEAYVTAPLLHKLGVSCLLVGDVPVIHQ